jgi:hypothetical protein
MIVLALLTASVVSLGVCWMSSAGHPPTTALGFAMIPLSLGATIGFFVLALRLSRRPR